MTVAPLVALSRVALVVASSGLVKVDKALVAVDVESDEKSKLGCVRKENCEPSDADNVDWDVVEVVAGMVIRLVSLELDVLVALPLGNVIDVTEALVALTSVKVVVPFATEVDTGAAEVVLFESWLEGAEVIDAADVVAFEEPLADSVVMGSALVIEQRRSPELHVDVDVLLTPVGTALADSEGAEVIVEAPLVNDDGSALAVVDVLTSEKLEVALSVGRIEDTMQSKPEQVEDASALLVAEVADSCAVHSCLPCL